MGDGRPYKIVLAGRYGVGKSTIFSKLKEVWSGEGTVDEGTGLSGRGNDKWTVTVDTPSGMEVTVALWDTVGMERFGSRNMPSQNYFHDCSGVILVLDPGMRATLDELKEWVETARDYGNNPVFSLWKNDTGVQDNPIDPGSIHDFARAFSIPSSLMFPVNADSGDNLVDSFRQVVDAVHLTDTNPRLAEDRYGDVVDLHQPPPQKGWWQKICDCY